MEERKIGVFKQLFIALLQPGRYVELLHRKKMILAFLSIFLLSMLGFVLGPLQILVALGGTSGVREIIDDNIPDFEIRDGRLYIESDYLYNENDVCVYITDQIDVISADDALNMYKEDEYKIVLVLGKYNGVLVNNSQVQKFDYSSFGPAVINKDTIVKILAYVYIGIILAVLIVIGVIVLWYLLKSLLYAIVASIIQSMMSMPYKLSFGKLFSLSCCAKLPMFIISTILLFYLDTFYGKNIISIVVTLIYIYLALKSIKKDQMKYVEMENQAYGDPSYMMNNGQYMNQNQGYTNNGQYMNQNQGYTNNGQYMNQNQGYTNNDQYMNQNQGYANNGQYMNQNQGYANNDPMMNQNQGYPNNDQYMNQDQGNTYND